MIKIKFREFLFEDPILKNFLKQLSSKISLSGVSVEREREFERENISRKRESYLKMNPLDRCRDDPVYRSKVSQLREGLEVFSGAVPEGWILDLGGNTGGETTVLLQEGLKMILSDINEVALEVARARADKFELKPPHCVAADVHALPFADQTFEVVMVIEALHHFEDYDAALKEIFRVLEPGGGIMALEPIGWNPFRRMGEIRDRFRGTIEKSFTRGQLNRLLKRVGFEAIEVKAVSGGRSEFRMSDVPFYRRGVARFHAWLQRHHPRFFGAYQIWAVKPGESSGLPKEWPEFLTTPGGESKVDHRGDSWCSEGMCYPDHCGVPVLIESDGTKQSS